MRGKYLFVIVSIILVTSIIAGSIVINYIIKKHSDTPVVKGEIDKTESDITMTLEQAAAYQKSEIWRRNDETYVIDEPNIYVISTSVDKKLYSNIEGVGVVMVKSGDAIYLKLEETDETLAYLTAGGEVYINDFFSIKYDFQERTFINEKGAVRARLSDVKDVDTGRATMAVYDNDNRIIVYHEKGIIDGCDAFTVAYNDICSDVSYMLILAYETMLMWE